MIPFRVMQTMTTLGDVVGPGRFGRTWTDQQLREAVNASRNYFQVCQRLGLARRSVIVVNRTQQLGLDTSHFTSQTTRVEHRQFAVRLEDILQNKRPFPSSFVKKRLLKEGLLTYHCYECSLKDWRGNPITLELDHIDGNNRNNTLVNLRLLCPNCHAQTSTYCGRGQRPRMAQTRCYKCATCCRDISVGATHCRACAPKRRTERTWPPNAELHQLVSVLGPLAASRRLSISRHVLHEHLHQTGYYS